MLTNEKILAHKIHGKNLIILTQVESSYFVVFAQVIKSKKGINASLKVLAQKQITKGEAFDIFNQFASESNTGRQSSYENFSKPLALEASSISEKSAIQSDILLLQGQTTSGGFSAEIPTSAHATVSPYFPTKDIFLSTQMTCAPNTR